MTSLTTKNPWQHENENENERRMRLASMYGCMVDIRDEASLQHLHPPNFDMD